MSKIKNGGLDQYGGDPFEQQQFGTAGVEGVKAIQRRPTKLFYYLHAMLHNHRNASATVVAADAVKMTKNPLTIGAWRHSYKIHRDNYEVWQFMTERR